MAAAGCLLVATLLATVGAGPEPAPRALYPARLPAGVGRAIAARACLVCHSAQLITQQHKDEAAWEKTITQMEKWGAPVTPAQHDSLRAYLKLRFGPRAARDQGRAR